MTKEPRNRKIQVESSLKTTLNKIVNWGFWCSNVIFDLLEPTLQTDPRHEPAFNYLPTSGFTIQTSEIVSCRFWDEMTFQEITFCTCEYGLEVSHNWSNKTLGNMLRKIWYDFGCLSRCIKAFVQTCPKLPDPNI